MRNTIQIITILWAILFSSLSFGQNIEIKDLELPNAPALTLLDASTTEVETPKSVQAFTLSLVNNINNNFAFEVSPYMFFSKNKNFYRFNNFEVNKAGNLVHKPVFYSLFKDLSLSLAKVKKEESQNLSIGLRTNLIRYEQNQYVNNFIDADTYFTGTYLANKIPNNADIVSFILLKKSLSPKAFQILFEDLLDGNLVDFDDNAKTAQTKLKYQIKDADYAVVIAQKTGVETFSQIIARFKQYRTLKEASDLELDHYNALIKALNDDRPKPVFTLDFAAGYSHFFESSNFSGGQAGKFGTWLTGNLNAPISDSYLSFFFYGRYLVDDTNFDVATNSYTRSEDFDLGGKVEFEYHKLSFAYEYINRTKQKENYRSVGSIKVKFNDYISVNGGFGKNFEAADNLVTFLGVSWGLDYDNSFSTTK